MMKVKSFYFNFLLFLFLIIGISAGLCQAVRKADFAGETWNQLNGKHFIVFYDADWGEHNAREMLNAAENYYKKIGDMVGFTRYSDFWTWEERVKIFVFSDQESFVEKTGALVEYRIF